MDEPLILSRYRLLERVASGGSAEVWRAHDEQLDRPVAVKRLHPHLLPDDVSRQRLAAEARAAASLGHPVIVGIYDIDVDGDWPALVMELVDGEPLSARLARDGPLSERQAAAIGADLADALYHAHRQGVVHRDVKPGNVLIDRDGRARLVDFGIAHSLAETSARLTQAGTVIGTLRAMAPEQLAGREIGPRTDLYGLGVVLHEALTGEPPYAVTSPVALADAQRAGPPPMSGVDAPLATLVRACLAHDLEDRPIHAGAVAAALRAWAAGDPAPAAAFAVPTAAGVASTTAVTEVVSAPSGVPPVEAAAPERRSRFAGGFPLLAGGLVLVAAVAAALLGGDLLPAAGGPTTEPTPTERPTRRPTPEPALTGWQAELARKYLEDCGAEMDPSLIDGMQKKEAEELIKELTEACKGDGDDDRGGEGNGNGGGEGNGNGGGPGRGND